MGFKATVSLTEQIADHLGSEIIHGRLAPSQRIQELAIARTLGVSRGSVREALLILEGRNLIQIIPRRGAIVSDLGDDQIENLSRLTADLLVRLFQKTSRNLRRNPQEHLLAPLQAAVKSMEDSVERHDLDQLLKARLDLVEAAFPVAHDHYLESVVRGLIPAALRLTHLVSQKESFDMRDTTRSARALLDAILSGDEVRIQELIEASSRRERILATAAAVH